MKTAGVILAIALALVLQTTLTRFIVRGTVAVDLVLVVVVYVALSSGPVTGLMAGTIAGLIQDSLATGLIGIGGLAKTLVGFLAGIIGTQFIVARPLPRFVVFFAATVLHQPCDQPGCCSPGRLGTHAVGSDGAGNAASVSQRFNSSNCCRRVEYAEPQDLGCARSVVEGRMSLRMNCHGR